MGLSVCRLPIRRSFGVLRRGFAMLLLREPLKKRRWVAITIAVKPVQLVRNIPLRTQFAFPDTFVRFENCGVSYPLHGVEIDGNLIESFMICAIVTLLVSLTDKESLEGVNGQALRNVRRPVEDRFVAGPVDPVHNA
jgi:hypothetical protein